MYSQAVKLWRLTVLTCFNTGQGQVQRFNNHTALYRTHRFMYWMGWVKAIFEALATFDPNPLSVHVNSHNWAAVRLSETQQMPSCPWSWDRPPHWQSREQRPRAANPAVEPTSHRNRCTMEMSLLVISGCCVQCRVKAVPKTHPVYAPMLGGAGVWNILMAAPL